MAAFSAPSGMPAALASSRAGRAGGRTLAAGAGAYGIYKAARRALTETVPYAVAANGRGRRRFAPPAWLASCLPRVVPNLPPLKPGEVRVHHPKENAPLWHQKLIEDSAQAVLAALQQEARSHPDGFGRHILNAGVHVVFEDHGLGSSAPPNVIMLSPSILDDLSKHASGDMQTAVAGLHFILAHEMAHLYLRDAFENIRCGVKHYCNIRAHIAKLKQKPGARSARTATPADIYQQAASEAKALSWQHEFEADEVACALLARLRLPPDQWAAGMKLLRAHELEHMGSWIAGIEEKSKKKAQDGKQPAAEVAALAAHMGWPSIDEGLAQLKAARVKGDSPLLWQQYIRWTACVPLQALLEAANKQGSGKPSCLVSVGKTVVQPYMIVGPGACPVPAVLAMLNDLADIHPPTDVRIARVQHLATQLPMLQRSTAPPVEVGGRFEPGSMAQLIADRAEAQRRAESMIQAKQWLGRGPAWRRRLGGQRQVPLGRQQGRRWRLAGAGSNQRNGM